MIAVLLLVLVQSTHAEEVQRPLVSGVYPHLALYNDEDECGIGAVVQWAGRLWALTYAPHSPLGSSDMLYSIGPDLDLAVHPESVGGTPACRMIHRETQQLIIGPYVIDSGANVRVIPPSRMPGRLTGVARHLTEPDSKVYFATMEEGLYEVDLVSLEVTELYADNQGQITAGESDRHVANLPGYHGKGLYTGQGRVVYANNGEPGGEALLRPELTSGCLAEWDGAAWRVVRRNQFTEVSGPGSLYGNSEDDPIWSIGWDHRSLILMLLDGGTWRAYRLPKASHSYDGAHGWNTEWPRIRDVGEAQLRMTMHGAFWSFPRGFSAKTSSGLAPLSSYLKVIGDFARFGDRLVLGCDDAARSEFLNKRRAKGELEPPGRSHSNLRFLELEDLTSFGPTIGRGALWIDEPVVENAWSEPYLFDGFPLRGVYLAHAADTPITFRFQVDREGDGQWSDLERVEVGPSAALWHAFEASQAGAWLRLSIDRSVGHATAVFHYRTADARSSKPAERFKGLAAIEDQNRMGGLLRARGADLGTLAVLASDLEGADWREVGFYELTADLRLEPRNDPVALAWHRDRLAIPLDVLQEDAASLLYIDDEGNRWRLPRLTREQSSVPARICREVVTERDLFHAGGTFYELPARNAGGFAKLRPIATHPFAVHDYASYRGLLVMTGLRPDVEAGEHVIRSADGRAAVWVGEVDDLWALGKPRGFGGPWLDTPVEAGEVSDPYLLTGFEYEEIVLRHDGTEPTTFSLELDVTGTGLWLPWRTVVVDRDTTVREAIPKMLSAYWLRVKVNRTVRSTVQLSM